MSQRLPATESSAPLDAELRAKRTEARAEAAASSAIPRPFLWLFGATGAVVALLLYPYAVPLFLAATLAVTLYPLHLRLERAFERRRPTLAAALSTLALFLAVIAPLVLLSAYSAGAVARGVAWLKDHLQQEHLQELSEGKLPAPLRPVLGRALKSLPIGPDDVEAYAGRILGVLQAMGPQVASASAAAISNLMFVLFAFFFFIKEGVPLGNHLFNVLPLKRAHTARLFQDFVSVASASMLGVLFTAGGQAVALGLGFWAAGLPHVFFLAVLSFLSAFVPLVGSALAWVPVALGLGLFDSPAKGLALAAWSVVGVQVVDVGLKPLVLGDRMAMHTALTFLGMLGGLTLFGAVGFIAGPMCIAFFLSFLAMYERDYQDKVSLE